MKLYKPTIHGAPPVASRAIRNALIQGHRDEFRVGRMCRVLRVSRSGYSAWLRHFEIWRAQDNRELVLQIRLVHEQSRKTYGSPRVKQELHAQGIPCGESWVAKVWRAISL